jgi:MFS superfamily sulfate permease-like transporter
MIVFLVLCIIDLILNIIQAIIAAIVMALVGILKDALDDDKCTEYNGKCACTLTGDTSDLQSASFEC